MSRGGEPVNLVDGPWPGAAPTPEIERLPSVAVPESLDPDTLRWIILVVIAGLLVAMYMVVRIVQKLVMKIVLFLLLAGVGLSLWIQREDLQDCADTCSCSLYGVDVEIPDDKGCG